MTSVIRLGFTGAAAVLAVCVATPAYAGVLHADFHPRTVTGVTLLEGADGNEHTLMCPPDENVLSGGYTLSAPAGRSLSSAPADLLSTRPTEDATGWTVAVLKTLAPAGGKGADPGLADPEAGVHRGRGHPGRLSPRRRARRRIRPSDDPGTGKINRRLSPNCFSPRTRNHSTAGVVNGNETLRVPGGRNVTRRRRSGRRVHHIHRVHRLRRARGIMKTG